MTDRWAAIEQALERIKRYAVHNHVYVTGIKEAVKEVEAAVGEAKRRESELDHEVNGPSGLREQLEAARKGEQIELRMRKEAEARVAELERALNETYDLLRAGEADNALHALDAFLIRVGMRGEATSE